MTDQLMPQRLSDEELYGLIVELLEIEAPEPVGPTTRLIEDLGLDSLALFQVLLTLEALANVEETPQEVPELATLGECFAYYSRQYRDA